MHLEVDVEIRAAIERDMPALATWSGQVEDVFRPALEASDRVVLVALARGGFPIGHEHPRCRHMNAEAMTSRIIDYITVLIITYNEEANIARTLDRVKWARRVVIIDSGSTRR